MKLQLIIMVLFADMCHAGSPVVQVGVHRGNESGWLTGVVVGSNTTESDVITNAHGWRAGNGGPVRSEGQVEIRTDTGQTFSARLVFLGNPDGDFDLALVKVQAGGLPVAHLADRQPTEASQIIGWPKSLANPTPILSRTVNVGPSNSSWSGQIAEGWSGSPVVDRAGRIVGLVYARDNLMPRVYGHSLAPIRRMLRECSKLLCNHKAYQGVCAGGNCGTCAGGSCAIPQAQPNYARVTVQPRIRVSQPDQQPIGQPQLIPAVNGQPVPPRINMESLIDKLASDPRFKGEPGRNGSDGLPGMDAPQTAMTGLSPPAMVEPQGSGRGLLDKAMGLAEFAAMAAGGTSPLALAIWFATRRLRRGGSPDHSRFQPQPYF